MIFSTQICIPISLTYRKYNTVAIIAADANKHPSSERSKHTKIVLSLKMSILVESQCMFVKRHFTNMKCAAMIELYSITCFFISYETI